MPSVSKAQFRFFEGVKHGDIHKAGLSPSKAAEFVDSVDYSSLPAIRKRNIVKRANERLKQNK